MQKYYLDEGGFGAIFAATVKLQVCNCVPIVCSCVLIQCNCVLCPHGVLQCPLSYVTVSLGRMERHKKLSLRRIQCQKEPLVIVVEER